MKGLHNLHKAPGSTQRKKRLGRGNGSGIGSYSGKGIKGQKARSGNKGLTARSMRSYLLRIPKVRGFISDKPSFALAHLSDIEKHFKVGEAVNPKSLRLKGLLTSDGARVKILAKGTVQKKLNITAHAFSAGAKAAIEQAGGTAELIHATMKSKPSGTAAIPSETAQ